MKLYVVTRTDLPWSVRVVQGIHAATEFAALDPTVAGLPVVVCRAKDAHALAALSVSLRDEGISVFFWHEPDLKHELTALAFQSQDRPNLPHLHLL